MMTQELGRTAPSVGRFRAYNVRTYDALLRFTEDCPQPPHTRHVLMCECTLPDCDESVLLTLDEIARTIPDSGCRVIVPGHLPTGEFPEPMEQGDQFWVVQPPRS